MMDAPKCSLAMEVRAIVADPVELDPVPEGRRRVVPITGGRFEGHGELAVRGRIVPGGADTQLIREDGLTEADARYTLETEEGIQIDVPRGRSSSGPASAFPTRSCSNSGKWTEDRRLRTDD